MIVCLPLKWSEKIVLEQISFSEGSFFTWVNLTSVYSVSSLESY